MAGEAGAGGTSRRPDLQGWLGELAAIDPASLDERAALTAITALERLTRAAAGAQARLAARVDEAARERQRTEGLREAELGAGVGAQIALARMESPHRGARHLDLAKALVHQLPQTLASLCAGKVSEWQASLVARETAFLDPEVRRAIDERIADRLAGWGDAQTVREVSRLVYSAVPGAILERHARARAGRRVTLRPAPDTMCYLTALLPVEQGVAAYASLVREAGRVRATGVGPASRGAGQVMADTLVARLTGQATARGVPIEVGLVMATDTLLGDGDTPAHLVGFGAVPAGYARRLVRDTPAQVWVRRLFTRPGTGRIVGMDSRRRLFAGQLRHLVVLRDQFCRTPWCDAPIRHADHPLPRRDDGPTSEDNAQGLCEHCNYVKDAPGWTVRTTANPEGRHLVSVTTPTGEHYSSEAPAPPGTGPRLPPAPWVVEAPGVWSIRPRAG
jgi:Domain of unknown function (DUF222)